MEDVQLAVRHDLAQPRLGLVTRAARRIAEVQLRRSLRGDDVRRDPALDAHRTHDLSVDEPVELDLPRLELRERRQAGHELVDRVAPGPGSR